jgi:hypothetical protein
LEIRHEASRRGVPWDWIRDQKDRLVEIEREKRLPQVEARQAAWWSYVGRDSGSASFWRHGFKARFGRRLAVGADYTCVPCYDEIAAAVREQVDEYSAWSTEEIFAFLLADYQPFPARSRFWWEAWEEIEQRVASSEPREEVPF